MAMFINLPRVPLPGPRTLPVIGGKASVLRFLSDPVARMLALHEEFGEIAALSRNDPGWVCIFGSALNREVLSKPELYPNFIESPIRTPEDSAAAVMDLNILAQNGDEHRRTRRMFMTAFSKEHLRAYAEKMVEITTRRASGWTVPSPFATREEMTELSLEIAMGCMFGLGLVEARELSRHTVRFMDLVLSPAATLFPVRLPGTTYDDYMTTSERINEQFRRLIARRRREGLADDVFSALIGAKDEDGQGMPDDELVGQATTLFNASHETTAMTLTWACLMLATHPELQLAAAEEVQTMIGDASPTLEDLDHMPLIGWIIDETLRLFPATPNMFFRRSSAESELAGYRLPAGATLLVSPLVSHRDPKLYPEPRRFMPRRWEDLRVGPYEYIPFGAGARRCVGAGFAGQAMRLALAIMLQRIRISAPRPLNINYRAKGVVLSIQGDIDLELSTPEQGVSAPAPITGTVERLVEFRH